MKKINSILLVIILLIIIILSAFIINTFKRGTYYVGKIVSIDIENGITNIIVSPVESELSFAHEIDAVHKIQFDDTIPIVGLKDRFKHREDITIEEMKKIIANLNAGDTIVFKVIFYDKLNYNLEISSLAMNITKE